MALQVWLPLNGDFHNQGLSNTIATNNGAIIDNNGKIGQCYSFDGTDDYITLTNINCNAWAQCSISFWCYPINSFNYLFLARGSGAHRFRISGDGLVFRDTNHSNQSNVSFNTTIATNTWSHIACVYNRGEVYMYVNGILTNHSTTYYNANSVLLSDLNEYRIGRQQSTSGNNYYNGKLNDFRIYDHALSPKEVKEISKGLVLHYQLKDLGSTQQHKNLLPDTNVNSLTKVIGAANRYYEQKSQSGYTATWESISDPPVPGILWGVRYVITAVNGFHGVTWYDGNTISVGAEPYTLSCYAKRVSGTNVQLKFEYGKSPYVTETFTMANDNEWHQYSWTFTPATASGQAAASGTTRIYGPGPASISEIIVCGWKLEKGTVATPWTETGNIIVDCSGFNHHGVTIGAPSNPANSVRFDKAVKFSATTQHIMVPDFPTSGFGDSYTFAWWGTRSANNTMFWSFANGIKLNGMYNGNLWNTFDSSDNPLYTPGTTTQVTASAVSTWNHWVMTGDGTSCKVYKDGELFGVAKTYKSISGSTFFINGYCALTNYASNNLTISDFRIYSTALSADDVKELFKTSMTTSGTARGII